MKIRAGGLFTSPERENTHFKDFLFQSITWNYLIVSGLLPYPTVLANLIIGNTDFKINRRADNIHRSYRLTSAHLFNVGLIACLHCKTLHHLTGVGQISRSPHSFNQKNQNVNCRFFPHHVTV
jgi:hypothetical protein